MTTLSKKLTVFLFLLLGLQMSVAVAQYANSFPSVRLNSKTLEVQKQADEVFDRRAYDRAYFIYRNELATIGDKYGQYMVGFMYVTGKGIEEDRVAASAWYRLAAERGIKEFVQARDELMDNFDEQERARSDVMFVDLRKEYGDLALLMDAVREDYEILKSRTGSRLASDSGALTIIDTRGRASPQSGAEYYGLIEKRMKTRLAFIVKHTKIEIIDFDVDNFDLSTIEARVNKHLDVLD